MSIDLVVFKHNRHFLAHPLWAHFATDALTGQVYSSNPPVADGELGEIKAIERRLGNVSQIAYLCRLLEPVIERKGLTLSPQLLRMHSPYRDYISINDCEALLSEMAVLSEEFRDVDDACVQYFMGIVKEVATVAQQEGNPIVII